MTSSPGFQVRPTERNHVTPGLEDIWQLHWGNAAGAEWNSAGVYIANGVDPTEVATALTAPPRGGGAGRTGGAAPTAGGVAGAADAPPAAGAQAPAAPPTTATTPAPTPEAGRGQPVAQGATGAGRGGRGAPPHSPAYLIKISVQPDGTFTVTNTRNGFSKMYVAR